MSDDHYVAQTYLKHFIDTTKPGFVHVYRKSDLKVHPAAPKTICFEKDGDQNPYFDDPLILRKYLREVEPLWNKCISELEGRRSSDQTKFIVSGYIAFLRACSPTTRRTGVQSLEAMIDSTRPLLARHVHNEVINNEDADRIVEVLLHPEISVSVDRNYVRAIGIENIINIQKIYYESPWCVLTNESDSPFLTSDFPANFYYHNNNPQFADVYVPLTPKIAVLISPPSNPRSSVQNHDAYGIMKNQKVRLFNKLVVQCAEHMIIANCKKDWIFNLVKKYRRWHVESMNDNIPAQAGSYFISRMRPVEKPRSNTL